MWWLCGGLMSELKKLENGIIGIASNSVLNIASYIIFWIIEIIWVFS
jgi:hypothetical protein